MLTCDCPKKKRALHTRSKNPLGIRARIRQQEDWLTANRYRVSNFEESPPSRKQAISSGYIDTQASHLRHRQMPAPDCDFGVPRSRITIVRRWMSRSQELRNLARGALRELCSPCNASLRNVAYPYTLALSCLFPLNRMPAPNIACFETLNILRR